MRRLLALLVVLLFAGPARGEEEETTVPTPGRPLTDAQVSAFADLALGGITREYPNKPSQVMAGPEDVRSPRELHPVFYGCFDWHSAVHGHWTLVRLLRLHPQASAAERIRARLDAQFTEAGLGAEAAYFEAGHNRAFERTYGWAWALRLAQALRTFDDPDAKRWARHFGPLERVLVELTKDFLPRMTWPLRSGEHRDTAFALAFFLDYARAVGDEALEALVTERARTWYGGDTDYPTRYEPSGHDFFSAGLNEADLMRRVLAPDAYGPWLDRFWPGLRTRALGNWGAPAAVADLEDGKLVHLVGLNLTRAWTLRGIAAALPAGDPRVATLDGLAAAHARAGLAQVFSGHYAGEHWLGSFAVYLLTDAGLAR